ncbi:hypothetical protein DF185_02210 [Marinifilum breve]|uniref:DUF2971 domain-containing protein n=1 Tax=Marinifilum breve TaxID=2184082 RepID=A0A2V4A2B0_9BACT|nr:DUF2971 domain-containing protein [Marinifilum breve]PXY02929.1 hypothetical protein DF185_02210 [Marinifilum breve]
MKMRNATFEKMKGEYPEILYKYRSWSDPFHKKVITHRELFYSAPSWFEDPKDCRSMVRYDLLTQQERIKWIEFKLRQEEPGKSRNYYRARSRELFKTSVLSNDKQTKEFQDNTFKEYDTRTGVLSLTGNPNNDEMWEKYSDNAKGFCMGYDPLILFNQLGGGGKVEYVDELPKIMPEPIHSRDLQMIYQLYYKEEKWSFEEEYRTHTFRPKPMTNEDRTIIVPAEAFKELILGKEMTKEFKNDLINNIPEELKGIKIIEK